jgi:hypothetical protein
MLASVAAYIRRHHLGLIAVVIALGGTAVAASATNLSGRDQRAAAKACPKKTKHFGDYCVRDTGKDLEFRDALALCADKKMRLPSVTEAEYIARGYDLPLPGVHTAYWTYEFEAVDDVILGGQDSGSFASGTPEPGNNNYVLCISDAST